MIIRNLDALGIAVRPDKAQPPLVIDAYTVLAFTIAFQGFEMVSGRAAQIGQCPGIVEHTQLTPDDLLNIPRQAPRHLAAPYLLGFLVLESSDHKGYRNATRYGASNIIAVGASFPTEADMKYRNLVVFQWIPGFRCAASGLGTGFPLTRE